AVRANVVRLAPVDRSRVTRPAIPWRADVLASTTSRTTFVTIAIRPSCRAGRPREMPLIWGRGKALSCPSCHCAAGHPAVIPGRAAWRGPGIHNHETWLFARGWGGVVVSRQALVVMDSGLALRIAPERRTLSFRDAPLGAGPESITTKRRCCTRLGRHSVFTTSSRGYGFRARAF